MTTQFTPTTRRPPIPEPKLHLYHPGPSDDQLFPQAWPPFLAPRELTLLAAPPGSGKTALALDIAARISSDRPRPAPPNLASPPDDPALLQEHTPAVLLISADDSREQLYLRLKHAGANLDRIHCLSLYPEFVSGFDDLEQAILEIPHYISLIIIDPITAFLRPKFLADDFFSLTSTAHEYHAATLLLAPTQIPLFHPRHSPADFLRCFPNGPLATRPRSILSIFGSSQNSELRTQNSVNDRFLVPIKSNLSALPAPLHFSLGPTLTWHSPESEPLDPATQEAVAFLQNLLRQGPQPATAILSAASQNLLSRHHLYRAKHHLKIDSNRQDFHSPYYWCLPCSPPQVTPPSPADPADPAFLRRS